MSMITTKEYIEKLRLNNINIKLKEGSIYKGSKESIIHICPFCGNDWKVDPNSILNGTKGCRECMGNSEWTENEIVFELRKYLTENINLKGMSKKRRVIQRYKT